MPILITLNLFQGLKEFEIEMPKQVRHDSLRIQRDKQSIWDVREYQNTNILF